MPIYRDSMESCPRCATELVSAGAARACETCSGLWLGVADLDEMAANMQIPMQTVHPTPGEFSTRAEMLKCPTCTEPMRTLTLLGVEIDVCNKKHGIWFDANELALVLLRSASTTQ
ncbi:hypothetical protein BH11MYX2_BH11MYX2_33710 [soil metagenome]